MIELSLVDNAADLQQVCGELATAGLVGLDTEFVRERTYYPELCLIQVATPRLIACIDCLASIDLDQFLDTLLDVDRVWVIHSARQDLEVIWNRAGRLPAKLIDTQIAGALTGLPPQASLQNMLEKTLGIGIEKDQTRAEWNRRPLGKAALRYALNDVRHLLDAWQVLEKELNQAGRLQWLQEECARLLEASPDATAEALYERMKGVGGLKPAQQAAALALIQWRESRARALDRPRRWVLSDEQLLRIARDQPLDQNALEAIPELPGKLIRRHGAELTDAVRRGRNKGAHPAPENRRRAERPDKEKLKAIQTQIRQRAEQLGIAAELLATRRDAIALAGGRPPAHIAQGWRATILADLI